VFLQLYIGSTYTGLRQSYSKSIPIYDQNAHDNAEAKLN
jgi:hypothetical protein